MPRKTEGNREHSPWQQSDVRGGQEGEEWRGLAIAHGKRIRGRLTSQARGGCGQKFLGCSSRSEPPSFASPTMNRRRFVTSSAGLLATSSVAGPTVADTADFPPAASLPQPASQSSPLTLHHSDVVLFQGDSITDAKRNRRAQAIANDPRALGQGYARIIAGDLLAEHAKLDLQVFNRGISGNKIPDLDLRWQADTLALEPKVLSILIGVNDLWHKLSGRYHGTATDYRTGFAALLAKTRQALPDVQLVICEPFVLRCGAVDARWFPEFDERKAFAREVAEVAAATWVPFQEAFDHAVEAGSALESLAEDGVHPTPAGHALMARTWREATGL